MNDPVVLPSDARTIDLYHITIFVLAMPAVGDHDNYIFFGGCGWQYDYP